MKTYERVDAEADCNILDGGDLFTYLEEYCWRHPSTKGMNKVMRKLLALQICRDKGLKVESDPDEEEIYKQVIDTYVARHHELHRQYPDAYHLCVSVRCLCDLFDLLQERGVDTTDDGVQWLSEGYTDEIRNSLKTAEGRKQLLDKLAYSVEHAEEIYMQNVTKYAIQQAAQKQIAKVMHDHPGIELLMEWFLPKHKPHSFSKH